MERFQQLYTHLKQVCPQMDLRLSEPMASHTTFRIGGPATLMALPATQDEVTLAIKIAAEYDIVPFFMGNGSNLLVADEGVNRFIIKAAQGLSACAVDGETIRAQSGITLAKLAVFAKKCSLSGLEFAHGIPGSLGGAITMNAGAYGGEMAQVVGCVVCINADATMEEVTDFDFSYRHSAFADGARMILSAKIQLEKADEAVIAEKMRELMAKRQEKQPLEYPSAGSIFKRPPQQFAAALIDQCGLKGLRVGGAQVSEKHAGFIINCGGATCYDVQTLIEQVRETVFKQTGVVLETEVKLLG